MDNDLISIDDLVRRRLAGGEEQERSGAWLRMRELLDKEEDRKPVGFLWRRMFGAMGILVLVAAVSLGGYELTNQYHQYGAAATALTAVPGSSNSMGHGGSSVANSTNVAIAGANNMDNNNSEKNNNNLTVALHKNNTVAKKVHNNTHKKSLNNNEIKTTQTGLAATATPNNNTAGATTSAIGGDAVYASTAKMPVDSGNKTAHHKAGVRHTGDAGNNDDNGIVNTVLRNTNTPTDKQMRHAVAVNKNKPATHHAKTATHTTTSGHQVAITGGRSGGKNGDKNQSISHPLLAGNANGASLPAGVAAGSHETIAGINGDNTSTIVKHTKHKSGRNTKGTKPIASTGRAVAHKSVGEVAGNTTATSGDHTMKAKLANSNKRHKVANTGDGQPVASVDKGGVKTTGHTTKDATAKSSLASDSKSSIARQRILAASGGAPATSSKKTGTNGQLLAANNNGMKKGGKSKTGGNSSSKTPGNNFAGGAVATIHGLVADGDNGDNTGIDKKVRTKARKGIKTIRQITVMQRMMQTGPNTYSSSYDTISIENINEEFAFNDDEKEFGPQQWKDPADETNALAAAGNNLIVPAAAASEDMPAGAGMNKTENAKKKAAGHALENLESAMNAIKSNISGARFAAGLKGGINGTFFGPNDFKGFQFGVTGSFIFSESVSILSELEYFHRINNDYVLNDNYYTYTQIGPNLWSKQEMLNPYSFSTLHSFELPVILRYSKGNFNFFGGMNAVYSFAVNEGAALPVAATTPAFNATSVGNDNAPKIQANDFNARFGLGYLFGVGVQLTPELSVDLRDVQTFWDNAKSSGAKEVSTQLYKSPSFQLSVGYRFGTKKGKNK